jgi:xylulose-5-phosphate/fructose-6-phosphate phosphoketolase
VDLFTLSRPVIFAFHGYQREVHEIVHGRPNVERFHVRGFNEQGTTTTPFQMVVLNSMSRYHLAFEALRRTTRPGGEEGRKALMDECLAAIARATTYAREHLEDPPEIRDWVWTDA